MLQNMQNVYFKAINTTGKKSDFFRSAAVAYMTINMTIESMQSEKSEVIVTTKSSQCVEWISRQIKDGTPSASLLASVEIVGAGQLFCLVWLPEIFVILFPFLFSYILLFIDVLLFSNFSYSIKFYLFILWGHLYMR